MLDVFTPSHLYRGVVGRLLAEAVAEAFNLELQRQRVERAADDDDELVLLDGFGAVAATDGFRLTLVVMMSW